MRIIDPIPYPYIKRFNFYRYPAPLMVRIADLSKDVAKNYREQKKSKLQRTFVSATDAAENKISKLIKTLNIKSETIAFCRAKKNRSWNLHIKSTKINVLKRHNVLITFI